MWILPVVVAVVVSGALLVSPLPGAAVATALTWLAVLGTLAVLRAGAADPAVAARAAQLVVDERAPRWPPVLRGAATGVVLTLALLGVGRAVLLVSWEPLVVAAVLVVSVLPWWLVPARRIALYAVARSDTGRGGTDAENHVMLGHRRRRVLELSTATSLGVTALLACTALFLLLADGSQALGSDLPWAWTGGLTGTTFAPVSASVNALAGILATVAAALTVQVRPAPRSPFRRLCLWCLLGALLAAGGCAALVPAWT